MRQRIFLPRRISLGLTILAVFSPRLMSLGLTVALLFSLSCQRNTAIPVPVIDQVGHAINVSDVLLTSATNFYSAQKHACAQAQSTCRFSSQGLQSYRSSLLKANASFSRVVAVYRQWQQGEIGQNQVQAQLVNLNRELSVIRINCGEECE